jgi:hypothetical protein
MSLCEGGAVIQARSETKLRLQAATITRGEKTMRTMKLKSTMKALVLLAGMILAGTVVAFGQQTVNLTAAPTTTTLPDGTTVPMWGYFCTPLATGVTSTATCGPLNPSSAGNATAVPPVPATWSPVLITIPYSATGTNLTINLTNNLSFTPTGSTPNNIPTSIVIVGQVGGGLGVVSQITTTTSPDHSLAQGCPTWFIASGATPPGVPCPAAQPGASGTPPAQSARVQSFSTEAAVGTPVTLNWPALRPGTYLLESGTHPSVQVPMGLIGMLVVTTAPSGATAGTAYPGLAATTTTAAIPAVQYNAEIPLEFSEIDPVQNRAVNAAVNTAGFSETKVWSGMVGQCGNPNSPVGVVNTCYPPVVNYTPFYYLIDGLAFNKTNASLSLFAATAGVGTTGLPVTTGIPATGTVLVRLVNAGLRMHVPSIVGSQTHGFNGAGVRTTVSGFALIAEDGNVIPNVAPAGATIVPAAPRVQTDVFMAAGKTFDAMINVPAPPSGATVPPSLPVYDRELSLSANSSARDAGMLAYIAVNGAGLPAANGSGVFSAAKANTDTYDTLVAGQVFSVTDPSKGVIANDVNVYGVNLLTAPTNGTVTCNALPGTSAPGICANGTFTYTPTAGSTATSDSFTYCANNGFTPAAGTTAASCSLPALTATVNLGPTNLKGNPVANNTTYTSKMSSFIKVASPGVLSVDSDPSNLPLQVVVSSVSSATASINMDPNGGFTASVPSCTVSTGCPVTFTYQAQNSQGRLSNAATVTLTFPTPSNLNVNVVDAQAYNNCNGAIACIVSLVPITDYRWIIEEDKTFWVDPNCTTNASSTTPGCPSIVGPAGTSTVPTFGVNFHTSAMDFVAQGCTGPLSCEGGQTFLNPATGTHDPAVCDVGNGACRPDTTGQGFTAVTPDEVHLDPSKRYYISVLPGDAANPFPAYLGQPGCDPTTGAQTGNAPCGHTMSGAPIAAACNINSSSTTAVCNSTSTQAFAPVTVLTLPTPLPTGKLSVMVFEDDFPLNGEQDTGGGVDTLSPNEPGLGGFNLVLWDTYGGLGDVTGQDSNDMFNMPLGNSLSGTVDPATGNDACPISANALQGPAGAGPAPASGMTGMIVTCPKYESDGKTLSPLAGQAIIANLMPEKFSVQAYPGADRIARGEEWLQTNTLDGQHPHDAFIRIGEPSYFQEYGPAGYHVSIGFANPKIINDRHPAVCAGAYGAVGACTGTVKGQVDVQRMSRTPDQRLYPSGSRDALSWTQCWVSLGDPDAEDFMFTKCDANGNFQFTGVPAGSWRLTLGDQWNDQIIDGLSTPANVTAGATLDLGKIGTQQWQSNVYTTTFIDDNKNGIRDPGEIGIPLIYTRVYYRDGHNSNGLTTDFNGVANFNETFPLFNWYVVEADSTRYKTTGIHTVYDAGGPADGSTYCGPANGARPCGTSTGYSFMANTYEAVPLPADLSVPGAVYCAAADCATEGSSNINGVLFGSASHQANSTGRIDPPWVLGEAWSGLLGQGNWIEFGKALYAACNSALPASTTNFCVMSGATNTGWGENGGIQGQVTYASTRPFDDASQMILQPWEPLVPNVTINLYQEGFAADDATPTLTLVDTTKSTSWDVWAQGFYPNSTAGSGSGVGQKPYMSCPGQGTATGANADLFFFTLFDQPNYLDVYNAQHNGGTLHTLPYNSQYKCYDAMHIGNQVQPAPIDGQYAFPSSLGIDATTGKQLTTQITAAISPIGKAASMPGTYCTICVPNPDTTDHYRVGTPMLPPGKYVLEVIMPPGYEVYKEEDKNLLIGDNYIAPVTQEFGGLGADIFIIPDQASVASMYDESAAGYNPNNFQDSTTALGLADELSGVPGYPGFQDPLWPCVGEMRVVPDYLSLFPQALEVAPFAGATRPLCDRKEVILANQLSVRAHFAVFTSTHIASKYTGVITDDFTSEFDPFAPQFGEKFAPPNMPVSTRDYLGNEISRVYSDHWGIFDGLTFSSWEVNPPNITGYSPTMMVQCMNDAGPIRDTRTTIPNPSGTGNITNPTFGEMINDPLYNPAYSDFCYEEPYMPGLTTYLDTPVVPTQAFVGAGYDNADCNYPDLTPAIAEVDSSDGIGPWVSAAGHTLTITALGDQQVTNYGYTGPSSSVAPFNQKTVKRHYGFGTRCTAVSATCTAVSKVTIGGSPATITGWSDTTITVTVPGLSGTMPVPTCTIQQQAQFGGPTSTTPARCGELVVTAGNGKQSVDAVTVTVGGKKPVHVNATGSIQAAIDAAAPGDLIIVDPTCTTGSTHNIIPCSSTGLTKVPSSHTEMLIMWKPVRLQGVGAASSIISANVQPAGKLLDPWRRHVNCLFGLTLQGVPFGNTTPFDSPTDTANNGMPYACPDTGWQHFTGMGQTVTGGTVTVGSSPQIDRLPLEATVGWDASLNGNLAEMLQEPSLMGAYEGAGITVLAKGVEFHGVDPWNDANEAGAFPTTTTLLTGVVSNPSAAPGTAGGLQVGDANPLCHTVSYSSTGAVTITNQANPYPSNYICNPSSIDGLSVTNSSQGGGGIFIHGWAHYIEVANNRIYNNAGTLSGGISVGQGEFAPPYIQGGTTNAAPGSCSNGTLQVLNEHMPDCFQLHPNVHNNSITANSSIGDELFSGTLSGGGGISFCTGNDYYKFNFNWICGNLSSGEGGGLVHLGEIFNGDIEHNSFVFNQSSNPSIPTNGGAIQVMGTPDTDPTCPGVPDTDCPPGLSDGTGPGLLINANLIQGNSADSGSGGAIRLQQVNGTEVGTFASQPQHWHDVTITNNIIANNLAGWDGAGISLQDALNVKIINNTIAHNDSLASSGVLTTSLGAPMASAPSGNCTMTGPTGANTASCPQSSGLTSTQNSALLTSTFTGLTITCPPGMTNCRSISDPILYNDVFYQNRAFYVGVTGSGTGNLNQQNQVALFDASGAAVPAQTATGSCTGTDSYWDIGVRGDQWASGGPNHASGFTLHPINSLIGVNPNFVTQYCNGSRVPPECTVADGCGGTHGFGVPPGIADAVTPNPLFSLVPSATVDEGNNWINLSWGPLSLTNPSVTGGTFNNYGGGPQLGNYSLLAGSPAINAITCGAGSTTTSCLPSGEITPAPSTDFFGKPRPDSTNTSHIDVGAVEF